ncbi:MAG: 3-oxoadipyl-CoA thiolase [Pseudohongiellaceae bacterium]
MIDAYICDSVRTPFGRFGGGLSTIRCDDLAALPLKALMLRNPQVDWDAVDDVIFGCANQAGEDNRNLARMASLLAGLPVCVSGTTINRLCGSSLDAIAIAARCIKSNEADLIIAGGAESMSRAPFVMNKADSSFSRNMKLEDTTIGWRFINPRMKELFGVDAMPDTAENVAREYNINRADQDDFALRSQWRTAAAEKNGWLAQEIVPVEISRRGTDIKFVSTDEHPRADTTLDKLQKLLPIVNASGTITAGNASGVNDGAGAIIIASAAAVDKHKLQPRARIIAATTAGVAPRVMGIGPTMAIAKLLQRTNTKITDLDVIEINEAFAAQVLAVTRNLGLADDAAFVNPNGGAIALGHPLGASGVRLVITAVNQLQRQQGRLALCSMCVGVGQGIAMLLERV